MLLLMDVISEALGPGPGPGAVHEDYYFSRYGEEDRQKDYSSPRHRLHLGLPPPPSPPLESQCPACPGRTSFSWPGQL